MYFGSVKFFKHLILAVVFGWIGVATVLAVYFGVKCRTLGEETDVNASFAGDVIYIPENASLNEVIVRLRELGYTDEDIAAAVGLGKTVMSGSIADDQAYVQNEPDTQTAPPQKISGDDDVQAYDTAVSDEPSVPAEADYTLLYPELYAQKSTQTVQASDKTVYLAFLDGPSQNTYDILYILNRQGVKATFFMSAGKTEESAELMRAVAEAGHTVGVHSFSHDTDIIYSSVEAYLTDFYDTYKMIYDACGVKASVFSFPDGSGSIPAAIREDIIAEMERRGFTYYDINAESGDRLAGASWQSIYDTAVANVHENTASGSASVLELHDSADDYISVITTEDIIIDLLSDGYSFGVLDGSVEIK